jgi:16S rRNA (cytosine1402-N4)-methyltransferase
VLQNASEAELSQIFWQLGDERYGRQIARAIVESRLTRRITTTKQLAELVAKVVPSKKGSRVHPATRVFQALRIYVNRELDNISAFLPAALKLLNPGGRLVCISFHSLEDRLVKEFFKEHEQKLELTLLTPKVVAPQDEEIEINPSSRSSKLRAIEKKSA